MRKLILIGLTGAGIGGFLWWRKHRDQTPKAPIHAPGEDFDEDWDDPDDFGPDDLNTSHPEGTPSS